MKVKSFLVHELGSGNSAMVAKIPQGSQFMTLHLLHDGIYAYYLVPELEGVPDMGISYMVSSKDTSIDTSIHEYVDSLEYYHADSMRSIIFHVFREKENRW